MSLSVSAVLCGEINLEVGEVGREVHNSASPEVSGEHVPCLSAITLRIHHLVTEKVSLVATDMSIPDMPEWR